VIDVGDVVLAWVDAGCKAVVLAEAGKKIFISNI